MERGWGGNMMTAINQMELVQIGALITMVVAFTAIYIVG
jgi:hypothetical protein